MFILRKWIKSSNMNRIITLLLGLLLCTNGIQAQGWMDRRVKAMRQRNQQRMNQRYNSQRTYQDYQRNGGQVVIPQRRDALQRRINYQQQGTNTERVQFSNSVSSLDTNNQIQSNDKTVTLVTS
jgi:hypothetical protein